MTSISPHTRDLIHVPSGYGKLILMISALSLFIANDLSASSEKDVKTVAALDTKYQAAVKSSDVATMDQILADDFVLITGRSKVFSKADLSESARKKEVTYEHQDEEPGTQKVRVWGDTAVVTALLWIKAVQAGKPIDYKLWFSDHLRSHRQAGDTSLVRLPCHCPKRIPGNPCRVAARGTPDCATRWATLLTAYLLSFGKTRRGF